MLVALTGTMIGFGAFGYSIVKLKDRQWREAAIAMVGGAALYVFSRFFLTRRPQHVQQAAAVIVKLK